MLPGKVYQFRVVGNSEYGTGESSEVKIKVIIFSMKHYNDLFCSTQILEVHTISEENIAGPPQNVQGRALNHEEIYLNWEPPVVTNGLISKYRIYYSEDDYGQDLYTDSLTLEGRLRDLKPYTEYTISVVPFNQNGMGDSSNEIKIKTFSAAPSEAPLNVSVEASSSTSVIIRWEPPPVEQRNGQITGYKIRYRKQKKAIQVETTAANIRYYELQNLDKLSKYQVKIAAININGTGPFSEWHSIETYENDLDESRVPESPSFIRTRPNAESIAVHWGSPEGQEIKVRGYVIGWGKGIPDEVTVIVDENTRYYEINGLESNSEYVISISARNQIGDGQPVYDYVRTREEALVDAPPRLEVPVGLRALTTSASSIVVYWTDTMLNKNQHVTDNRIYVVRYNQVDNTRYKFHNTTELNAMITDLKSNTQYEFAVKVVKGRRESAWSMSVLNVTHQATPALPPRDLRALADPINPANVLLTWASSKNTANYPSTNVIFYTTDKSQDDRDWLTQTVSDDVQNVTITNLRPYTTYYFKIQSRTGKTIRPLTSVISHVTGQNIVNVAGTTNAATSNLLNEMMIYIIIAISVVTLVIAIIVIAIICRRKPIETPEHAKKSYEKNNAGIVKPPDLWIHHDQMELKNMEKNHLTTPSCNDGASSSGAMTLPRSIIHDFETDPSMLHVTNSLDKRTYVAGYMTTPINNDRLQQYPRLQYSMPRGSHVDHTLSQSNLSHSQTGSISETPESPFSYDTMMSNYR